MSIHALREEGDLHIYKSYLRKIIISIHALREEGDYEHCYLRSEYHPFLSTPSVRRATDVWLAKVYRDAISIHALREEGDARF